MMEQRRHHFEDAQLDAEIDRLYRNDARAAQTNGMVEYFPGELRNIPEGYLALDPGGQPVSRKDHPRLWKFYGTKFGNGDDRTTFNLPSLPKRDDCIPMVKAG